MADVIESASTGRAKCRGCREAIPKGELRFGEKVENAFGEGEATHWFHLSCAADARGEKLLAAMTAFEADVPNRAEVETIARATAENPKLALVVRAERSPTARARCRSCREMIDKDAIRVAILNESDPTMAPTTSFVHARCAAEHLGARGLLDKLRRKSGVLDDAALAELARAIASDA